MSRTSPAAGGERFALAPQILQEFLQVATDPRRFEHPLPFADALKRADFWWRAAETVHCYPDDRATWQAFQWMRAHRLGRKRILENFLAVIFHCNGVTRLTTANREDFALFGVVSFEPWAVTE